MKTTIDKAGWVVIPVAIREQAMLKAGTELEVVLDDLSVRLIPARPGRNWFKRQGGGLSGPRPRGSNCPRWTWRR